MVATAAAALAPGAPLIHPEPHGAGAEPRLKQPGAPVAFAGKPDNIAMTFDYAQGDVAQGEAESDVVIEDVFRLHYVTHCCMGVSGVIAEFDPGGNLLLYSNTQVPFLHKREFAELLGIDPGAHPHHPAADRRRLRLQARHLSVRADRDLPRQDHAAAR